MKNSLSLSLLLFCATNAYPSWMCVSHDVSHKQWMISNDYRHIALTKAMHACKQKSRMPMSCTALKSACSEDNNNANPPMGHWKCTALDHMAKPFTGSASLTREDAASMALAGCHAHSALPDTCYLNFLTCNTS